MAINNLIAQGFNPGEGMVQAQQIRNQLAQQGLMNKLAMQKMEMARQNSVTGGAESFGLNPVYGQGPNGEIIPMQLSNRGGIRPVDLPQGTTIAPQLNWLNTGNAFTPVPKYGSPQGNMPQKMPIQPKVTETPTYRGQVKAAEAAGTSSVSKTPGQEAVDKKFAAEYADFVASGGYADFEKQINQLDEVATKLEESGSLTGWFVGNIPDFIQAGINPEAISARDAVEEVVQRNLRLILGAQFTEKEGQRLIARAYNPRLSEEENAKRVRNLMRQMKSAAEAKASAARYFEENGTLAGWKGKLPSMKDFAPEKQESKSQVWSIKRVD